MSAYTIAPAVKAGLSQATALWPERSKASDGTIGDAAHSSTTSDHNPDARGVVLAFDLTHDPGHGVDCNKLSAQLVDRRDHRVKYLIWSGRIWRSYKTSSAHPAPWTPQKYTGSNPHTKHMHVSVLQADETDVSAWWKPEEDDMALTDQDVQRIADAVYAKTTADLHAALDGFVRKDIERVQASVDKLAVAGIDLDELAELILVRLAERITS